MLTSPDGESWALLMNTVFPAPPALPPGGQMDSRDNYFLNLEGELRLYSYAGPPFLPAEDRYMIPHYSTVQVTRDGEKWTEPRAILDDGILWKPIFWRGKFWCAGYRRDATAGYVVELYRSKDGFEWTRGEFIAGGTETFLLPTDDHTLRAFVRTENKPYHMEIWESSLPCKTWLKIAVIPRIIQAPHVEKINAEYYLFGRETYAYGESRCPLQSGCAARRTKMWRLNRTEVEELVEFPSYGDTSYTGTVLRPDGLLLVSYYSQHEREVGVPAAERGGNDKPSDVFVAGIEI